MFVVDAAELEAPELGFFRPVSHATLRAHAVGAGDWSLLILREVARILDQTKGRRPAAFGKGIDQLLTLGVIRQEEVNQLKDIVTAFLSVMQEKGGESAKSKVINGYQQLLLDPDTSAPAIAIASVASRYVVGTEVLPPPPSLSRGAVALEISITPGSVGAGAAAGAIIGAGIGAYVGGVVGAGIGAGIGAAAGAAIGWSNS
jgi:hypothetical protein